MSKTMLWGGRFEKGPTDRALEFNSAENIALDSALVPYDIIGSLAHAKMLHKQGILSGGEHAAIAKALKAIYRDWESGRFSLDIKLEDVHMNVEAAVTARTPAGMKLHTARSRNDQVLLDMRLYMRDKALETMMALGALQDAFMELSRKDGPMAAYTHTRVAQPITVSFWCEGWSDSLGRDIERLMDAYKRVNQNPLGACAIAGTQWKIDRKMTAKLLAFDSVQENELDTISSRGECEAELLSALSIIMCKLSRLSEELIWLSQKGLVTISEEHTTGSSIMPNKKNPDVLELIRGRSGRVYGSLNHCLIALKGLMIGYNSDMQETKSAVMSGFSTTLASIAAAEMIVRGLGFDSVKTGEELDSGFAQATAIADYLAMRGIPFREAHGKAGKLVLHCEKANKTISRIPCKEACGVMGAGIPDADWETLRSFGRETLARRLKPKKWSFPLKEREGIEKAFKSLLAEKA